MIEPLICDRMGISYPDLYSDEMPYRIVQDYQIIMAEEALAYNRAREKSRKSG